MHHRLLLLPLLLACGEVGGQPDAVPGLDADSPAVQRDDAGPVNGGRADLGGLGQSPDLGALDADPFDAGPLDAGPLDALAPEATPPDAAPLPPELDAPGPYNVGFRMDDAIWESPFGERRLRTAIWYPTRDTNGNRARYIRAIFRDGVYDEATPAAGGPFPLMLFSHGSRGIAEQSFFLTEFFASHGWVVIAPDHPGDTFLDAAPPIYIQFELRPSDIGVALDHVLDLPPDDPLAGLVDTKRILMAGHSFGGYTSLARGGADLPIDGVIERCAELGFDGLCEYLEAAAPRYRAGFVDPRIDAVISMTPVWARVFEGGLDAMGRPVLLFTGERDGDLPNEQEGDRIWDWLAHPDDLRVDIANAGHLSFSDLCTVLPPIDAVADRGCSDDFIDPDRIKRIVKSWSLAFANRHVLGESRGADLLDGASAPDDAARVSRR